MLDKLMTAIAKKLDAYKTAVSEQRITIELERAGDDPRQHAGREFENSEGYTTPLPKAAQNAQNEYARACRDFVANGGAAALSAAVTLMIAREKRDETAAALERHVQAEKERQGTGVHHEVKAAFNTLFRHGVEPRHLATARPETMAIVADILRWDGRDRDMKDPASPMPDIFAVYASRLIVKPGKFINEAPSVPGHAVSQVKLTDPAYYRFDLFSPAAPTDDVAEPIQVEGRGPMIDGVPSLLDLEGEGVVQGAGVAPSVGPAIQALANAPDVSPVAELSHHASTPEKIEPTHMVVEVGEYALPAQYTAEDLEKLRAGAIYMIDGDPDWEYALKSAAGWFAGHLTTAQVIDLVANAPDRRDSAPFRHFVDAARLGGLEAGRHAYREATVRRWMHEIATSPSFATARVNLGLE